MITKTYRRYKYNNSLTINVKGVKRTINFKSIGKDMFDFVTSEPDVQEVIEKQTGYKHVFYLANTVITKDEEQELIVEDKVIVDDEDKDLALTSNDIVDDIIDGEGINEVAKEDIKIEQPKAPIVNKSKKPKRKSK